MFHSHSLFSLLFFWFAFVLQVFDEGHLTDGQGRRVDFRNTIIIMTSNLGAAASYEMGLTETAAIETLMLQAVRHHFPPEFVNRLDDIVVFQRLGPESMPSIVDIQMKDVQSLLAEQRVKVKISPEARQWLSIKGHDANYGARPLKRVIYKHVLNPLAAKILENKVMEGCTVELKVSSDKEDLDLVITDTGSGGAVKLSGTELIEPLEGVAEAEIEEVIQNAEKKSAEKKSGENKSGKKFGSAAL